MSRAPKHGTNSFALISAVITLVIAGSCAPQNSDSRERASRDSATHAIEIGSLQFSHAQTVPGLGAGQGIALHDGFVYLYGDADTGVIVECVFETSPRPALRPTGRTIRLTKNGRDVIPHPTGLTFNKQHGCWLGDTVNRRGVLHQLDWDRALKDGVLDRAILRSVSDDVAVQGSRPAFATWRGRRVLATSDYGDRANAVRLYDPAALKSADQTSEPGVVIAGFPCGPWVQNLLWEEHARSIVLVQNTREGLGYRLTVHRLDELGLTSGVQLDLRDASDELEGFAILSDECGVTLSSSSRDNVRFWTLSPAGASIKSAPHSHAANTE